MALSYPKTLPSAYITDNALTSAYRLGWSHGHGIACHNVPKLGAKLWTDGLGRVTVDADNIRDVHQTLCYDAEEHSRSYSSFELIAHEFISAEESDDEEVEGRSEELWEAFEAGASDAIEADLAEYDDEDYGITDDTDEAA